jgi:hypothetical protein
MTTDREAILNSDKWPNWPFLPVKRRRGGRHPEVGVLLANDKSLTVYIINLFQIRNGKSLAEQVSVMYSYPTVSEMLTEGWVVD